MTPDADTGVTPISHFWIFVFQTYRYEENTAGKSTSKLVDTPVRNLKYESILEKIKKIFKVVKERIGKEIWGDLLLLQTSTCGK